MEQLSESLGDGLSTRRISEDTRSGSTRKEAKNVTIFPSNKLFPKEDLGNPCIKRPPMLYYRGRRLNSLGSPFGIETDCFKSFVVDLSRLNSLGSPFGIETKATCCTEDMDSFRAK